MIIADTSIWVDHFRRKNKDLSILVEDGNIFCHPFVIGELACGNLRNRRTILSYLDTLPKGKSATNNEVLTMLEQRKLVGKGIGWIDAHLLSSALISKLKLWTSDKSLLEVAKSLKINFNPK